jgi:VWFA-related protein
MLLSLPKKSRPDQAAITRLQSPQSDKIFHMLKLLSLLACGALGLAAAQSGNPPGAPPQESGATIRTTAQEVVLDLVVRDSRGRPVKNLKPADIQIYEDGVRQTFRSFRFVQGREVLQQQSEPPDKGPDNAKPVAEATAPAPVAANPLRAVNLICIVFHNLDPYTKKYAVEAAQEFLKNQFEPDTWIAVFSLDAQLTVLQPFTTDREEVLRAAANTFTGRTVDFTSSADAVLNASPNIATVQVSVNGNPAKGGSVSATQRITGGALNPLANTGADVSNDAGANRVRGNEAEQRRVFNGIEARRGLDQMNELFSRLATLPGRKTVLLLSPGLASTGDPDLFKAMVERGNQANVSVYALDVNGLTENSNGLASGQALGHAASLSASQGQQAPRGTGGVTINPNTGSGSAAVSMEKMRQSDYVNAAVRTSDTQSTLRALSEGTGGFLIANTNDFRKTFARVLEDVDTHYAVTYKPTSDKYDGRLRTIEVKTARADLSVQSRTGYYALPPLGPSPELAPYEMAALAALNVPTPPKAFELRSAAYQFRPSSTGSQDAIAFEVPAANLTATPEPLQNRHHIELALLALVKDSTGQVIDKFSQDSPYDIADDKLAAARNSTFIFTHPVTLPPGHYTVEVAAVDRETNVASTGKLGLNIRPQQGVGLSSILLVQRLETIKGQVDATNPLEFQAQPAEGRRVIPELSTTLGADAHPYIYFVVYPDKSSAEKPKIQVEFLVNGQLLARQAADLPPADAAGAIPMVIGAATKPGKCELRITAQEGNSQIMQSAVYTIAAK